MVDNRDNVLDRIIDTLAYIDGKWGPKFDDKNTANDWVSHICAYASRGCTMNITREEFDKAMLAVVGIAISALEATDRNNGLPQRHYD